MNRPSSLRRRAARRPSRSRSAPACAGGSRHGAGLADQADHAWSCRSRPAAPPTCWRARSADTLPQSLGQPVIVESKPGAGTTLGADYVAKAKPDGYTLLVGAVHHTIASSVYKKLPYDFQKDLAPITTVAMVPNVLVGQCRSTPAKNVAELVALAKAAARQAAPTAPTATARRST